MSSSSHRVSYLSVLLISLLLILRPSNEQATFSFSDNQTGVRSQITFTFFLGVQVQDFSDRVIGNPSSLEVIYGNQFTFDDPTTPTCQRSLGAGPANLNCTVDAATRTITVTLNSQAGGLTTDSFILVISTFRNPTLSRQSYTGFDFTYTSGATTIGPTSNAFRGFRLIGGNPIVPNRCVATVFSSNLAQAQQGNMQFTFTTNNITPTNSIFKIDFPSGFDLDLQNIVIYRIQNPTAFGGGFPAASIVNPANLVTTVQTSRTSLNISLTIPVGGIPAGTFFYVLVQNVVMPRYQGQTPVFTLFTQQSGLKIDQNNNQRLTLTANCALSNIRVSFANPKASATSLFTIRFTNSIPYTTSNGEIEVDLPDDIVINAFSATPPGQCTYITYATPTALVCEVKAANTATKIITVRNTFLPSAGEQEVAVLTIVNPHQSGQLTTPFEISIRDPITSSLICQGSGTATFQAFDLTTTLTRPLNQVSQVTTLDIELTPESEIFPTDTIRLLIPNDQFGFESSNTQITVQVKGPRNSVYTTLSGAQATIGGITTRPVPGTVADIQIDIVGSVCVIAGQTNCLANRAIEFRINGKNAPWVIPTFSSEIRAFVLLQGLLNLNNAAGEIASSITLRVPTLSVQSFALTITRTQVTVFTSVDYTFSFQLSSWIPQGSLIRVKFPDLTAIQTSAGSLTVTSAGFTITLSNKSNYSPSSYFQHVDISGLCTSAAGCNSGTNISLTLSGFSNARTVFTPRTAVEGQFEVTVKTALLSAPISSSYLINSQTSAPLSTTTTNTFSQLTVAPGSLIVGDQVSYTFTLGVTTAIPAGGRIEIQSPSTIRTLDNATCSMLGGLRYRCSVQTNRSMFVIEGQTALTQIPAGQIQFQTNNRIRNPQTRTETDPFTAQSFATVKTVRSLIDTGVAANAANALTVQMTTSGPLTATVTRITGTPDPPGTSQVLNVDVHIRLKNPMPQNGRITMTVPSSIIVHRVAPDPAPSYTLTAPTGITPPPTLATTYGTGNPWTITLTGICPLSSSCPANQVFNFTIAQTQTPSSTRITADNIVISSFQADGTTEIDSISLKATPPITAGPLTVNQIQRNNNQVARTIQFELSITPTTAVSNTAKNLTAVDINFGANKVLYFQNSVTPVLQCFVQMPGSPTISGVSSCSPRKIQSQTDAAVNERYYTNIRVQLGGNIQRNRLIRIVIRGVRNPYNTAALTGTITVNTLHQLVALTPVQEQVFNTGTFVLNTPTTGLPPLTQVTLTTVSVTRTVTTVDAPSSVTVQLQPAIVTPKNFLTLLTIPRTLFEPLDGVTLVPTCTDARSVNIPCSVTSSTPTTIVLQISITCPTTTCPPTTAVPIVITGLRNSRSTFERGYTLSLQTTTTNSNIRIGTFTNPSISVSPSLTQQTIQSNTIVPTYTPNTTGSRSQLRIAFTLPSIVGATDILTLSLDNNSRQLIELDGATNPTCSRIDSSTTIVTCLNPTTSSANSSNYISSINVVFCATSGCTRGTNYTLLLDPVKIKRIDQPLTGILTMSFTTAAPNNSPISSGTVSLTSVLPTITPNVFSNLSITTLPSSCNKVGERCTSITLSLTPFNSFDGINAGGKIVVTLPAPGSATDGFDISASTVCTFNYLGLSGNCVINRPAETLTINSITASNIGAVTITLNNVILPPSVKQTPSFVFKSSKNIPAGGTEYTIDQSNSGLTYTANPGILPTANVVITRSNGITTVGESVIIRISLTILHRIPPNGSVLIVIPSNAQIQPITGAPTRICTLRTVPTTCTISGNNIEFTSLCAAGCNASSNFELYLGQNTNFFIRNKPFRKQPLDPSDSVVLRTQTNQIMSVRYTIDQSSSPLYITPVLTLGSLTYRSITRSSGNVGEISTYTFGITVSHLPVPNQGRIIINLPNNAIARSSRFATLICTIILPTGGRQIRTCFVDSTHPGTEYIRQIQILTVCTASAGCFLNQSIQIQIQNLQNPSSNVVTTQSLTITTATSQGYYIDQVSTPALNTILQALNAAVFRSVSIVPVDPTVDASPVNYNVIFTADTPFPSTTRLELTFPSSVGVSNSPVCRDLFVESNSSVSCSFDTSTRVLSVTGLFPETTNTGQFGFQLQGVSNPSTTGLTGDWPTALKEIVTSGVVAQTNARGPQIFVAQRSCTPPCRTCTQDSTTCTSCNVPSETPLLRESRCVTDCGDGYFFNPFDSKCYECHHSCLKCYNHKAKSCALCSSNLIFNDGQCISQCPLGTTLSTSPDSNITYCKNSAACNSPCKGCSLNPSFCFECQRTAVLSVLDIQEGTCVAPNNCSAGFYGNANTPICDTCQQPCLSCQGTPIACSKCNSAFTRNLLNPQRKTCKAECGEGQFSFTDFTKTPNQNQCRLCNPVCSYCSGRLPNQCTKCNQNIQGITKRLFLEHGKCVTQCSYPLTQNVEQSICQNQVDFLKSFCFWFLSVCCAIGFLITVVAFIVDISNFTCTNIIYAFVALIQALNRLLMFGTIFAVKEAMIFTFNGVNFFMSILWAVMFHVAHFMHLVQTSKRYEGIYTVYRSSILTAVVFSFFGGPPVLLFLSSFFCRAKALSNPLRMNAYYMEPFMRYMWFNLIFVVVQIGLCVLIIMKVPQQREAFICGCFGLVLNSLMVLCQICLYMKQRAKKWFYYTPQRDPSRMDSDQDEDNDARIDNKGEEDYYDDYEKPVIKVNNKRNR